MSSLYGSRGIWQGISKPRQVQIRAEVAQDLEDQLEEKRELMEQELRGEIRSAERQQMRREIEGELHREREAAAPSERQRQGFVDFVRDTEDDARALAQVASQRANSEERALHRSRWFFGPVPWLLFAGALPALWAAFIGASGVVGAIAVTALLVALMALIRNVQRHGRLERSVKADRRAASDYLIVAERARAYRQVHAERLESKQRITNLMERLQRDKEDVDQKFHPCAGELEEAKQSVRQQRIEVDLDGDFEERLAEAEAAAESEQKMLLVE